MVHRLWQEGYIDADSGRPLGAIRKSLKSSAKAYECDVAELPALAGTDEKRRLDMTFTWVDEDIALTALLVLQESEQDPRCVDWLLSVASAKRWRTSFYPPSMMLGLNDLRARDSAGMYLHAPRVLRCLDPDQKTAETIAEEIAGWLNDPQRCTGYVVLPQSRPPRYLTSGGLAQGVAVNELLRLALNDRLPTRSIPHKQARLFMPPCDGLPDVTTPTHSMEMDDGLENAFHQLLHTRARTPLPERWQQDPRVQTWWATDPFSPQPEPVPEPAPETEPRTDPTVAHIEAQLREALQQLDILRRQKRASDEKLAEATTTNEQLRKQLDEHTDYADLKAQVDLLQEEVTRRDVDLDAVETERDMLRRDNGLLLARLARAGADVVVGDDQGTREFDSFPQLLAAASTDLPGLVITAAPARAAVLDHHPKAAAWRRKTWDSLLTLHAYVTARTTSPAPSTTHSDVLTFVRTGQPGALISANIIKMVESETVLRTERFRAARFFPVGPDTDPSGHAYFGAHIALERYRNPAPRLYFLDDVARTGVLYIGYVGEHLPNTKTN